MLVYISLHSFQKEMRKPTSMHRVGSWKKTCLVSVYFCSLCTCWCQTEKWKKLLKKSWWSSADFSGLLTLGGGSTQGLLPHLGLDQDLLAFLKGFVAISWKIQFSSKRVCLKFAVDSLCFVPISFMDLIDLFVLFPHCSCSVTPFESRTLSLYFSVRCCFLYFEPPCSSSPAIVSAAV